MRGAQSTDGRLCETAVGRATSRGRRSSLQSIDYQSIFTRTPIVRGLLKKRRFEPGLELMLVA
jgi:hypothetical protein